MRGLTETLREYPIIAAVKDESCLEEAADSPCGIIFLLKGNICNIESMVKLVHNAKKQVYIHIDLMEGFGKDRYFLQYVKERLKPDGIMTTKSNLVKIAKSLSITAIQRVFLIDNLSFESGVESLKQNSPDAAEIMPGIMPAVTQKICREVSVPIITGGLVNEKNDIINSLNAGAVGVSTSTPQMWKYMDTIKKLRKCDNSVH